DRQPKPDDVQLEYDGLRLLIDPASAPHLDQATIDYFSDPFESGFLIKVAGRSRCGCGGH
ncbi:MAG TPA: hypothetical protein VIL08_05520, partial [Limnochorda sp.]